MLISERPNGPINNATMAYIATCMNDAGSNDSSAGLTLYRLVQHEPNRSVTVKRPVSPFNTPASQPASQTSKWSVK